MDVDVAAARLGSRHYGLITHEQAKRLGFTEGQIQQRLRSGRLRCVRDRVYAFAGAPATWEQAVLAAVWSLGDGVVASHHTALRLFGGRVGSGGAIEVSSDRARRVRVRGVRAHRSLVLFDEDRTTRHGIRTTSAARTIVDLSTRTTLDELGRMVDDLQRRRLLKLDDLARCLHRLGPAPGRSPAAVSAVLRARWVGYDAGDSDLESRVLRVLVGNGLPVPHQQVRVVVNGRRYYLDLAYPDIKLAIEIDSWAYHRWRTAFDRDRARGGNELTMHGWRVLHITDRMGDDEIVALVSRALTALGHSGVA